jgi:RHS repeat-associated protein
VIAADDVAIDPDGNLVVMQPSGIGRVESALPGISASEIGITSEDGTERFIFDALGRHQRTLDAKTGALLYQFTYTRGLLAAITDMNGQVTVVERDGSGAPSAIVAPGGQRSTLAVTGGGYLSSVTNPAGEALTMEYADGGLLTSFKDPRGNASTMQYDANGLLVKDRNAAGGSTTLSRSDDSATEYSVSAATALNRSSRLSVNYKTTGDRQQVATEQDGTVTNVAYQADGTIVSIAPDGTVTKTQPTPDPRWKMESPHNGSVLVITPAQQRLSVTQSTSVTLADERNPLSLIAETSILTVNGRSYASVFSAPTRVVTSTSPEGRITTTTLDPLLRPTSVRIPGLAETHYTYLANGLLSSVAAGNRTTSYTYDARQRLDTVTDSLNRVTRFRHDDADRVTEIVSPDNGTVDIAYDAAGNVASIRPPGRQPHLFEATAANLPARYTPPGSADTSYAYDNDGAITGVTGADGRTLRFVYDGSGRLEAEQLQRGDYRYSYTPDGHIRSVVTPDGELITYSFDGFLPMSQTWAGAILGSVSYGYDSDFAPLTERVACATATSLACQAIYFRYDNDKLLTGVGPLALTRDAANGLLARTAVASVAESLTYNEFGEMTDDVITSDGSVLYEEHLTRDRLGRIAQRRDVVAGVNTTSRYGYDAAGRLTSVEHDGPAGATYSYDSNGNRLAESHGQSAATSTFDGQDRLVMRGAAAFTYSPTGDLQSLTVADTSTHYALDEIGNLLSVTLPDGTVLDYLIDGMNRRIGKKRDGVIVDRWVYSDQRHIAAELDPDGNVTSRFVYATRSNTPDLVIKGDAVYRIIADHLGSVRLVVNANTGAIAQRLDYDEFGNILADTNPGFQPFGFAGGQYDVETRLVRFGARDYDSQTGRWISKDPLGFAGGGTNLYAYGWDDPVNFIDPTGTSGWLAIYSVTDTTEGSSSQLSRGHSWISYTPDNPASSSGQDPTDTYSTWSGMNTRGVPYGLNQNVEDRVGPYQPTSARFVHIDDAGEKRLMAEIARYRLKGWNYKSPCSAFAHDAWLAATGENLHHKYSDYSNPTSLDQGIKDANHGKPFWIKGR